MCSEKQRVCTGCRSVLGNPVDVCAFFYNALMEKLDISTCAGARTDEYKNCQFYAILPDEDVDPKDCIDCRRTARRKEAKKLPEGFWLEDEGSQIGEQHQQ